jgi:hypothetical protein
VTTLTSQPSFSTCTRAISSILQWTKILSTSFSTINIFPQNLSNSLPALATLLGPLTRSKRHHPPIMALPTPPVIPSTPFDFPKEILSQIIEHYYLNEVLVISEPYTRPFKKQHFSVRLHSTGPLSVYKKYFFHTRTSILALASTNRKLREQCLPVLAKYSYIDLSAKDETNLFLAVFPRSFRRQIKHVITRASYTDIWSNTLFQHSWPALQTLTIYEDWSATNIGRDKSSTSLTNAKIYNWHARKSGYTAAGQAVVSYIQEHEKLVVDCRASEEVGPARVASIVDHGWKKVQALLGTVGRQFKVEYAVYVNEEMDAILKVEEEAKPILLVYGMACERNDMARMEYFVRAAEEE